MTTETITERLKAVEEALSSAQRNTYMCHLQWEHCEKALSLLPDIIREVEAMQAEGQEEGEA